MAPPYLLAFTAVVYTGQILISNCQRLYFFSSGQKSWGHDSPVHTKPTQNPSSDDEAQELVWRYLSALVRVEYLMCILYTASLCPLVEFSFSHPA